MDSAQGELARRRTGAGGLSLRPLAGHLALWTKSDGPSYLAFRREARSGRHVEQRLPTAESRSLASVMRQAYVAVVGKVAIDPDAFNAFEAGGWEEKAAGYDRFFGRITGQLVEPLLDAASVGPGTRMLDLATGPGYVAARGAERGASVVGVDVAGAMVSLARGLHPGLDFRQADAHELPFDRRLLRRRRGQLPDLAPRTPRAGDGRIRARARSGRQARADGMGPTRARPLSGRVPRRGRGGRRNAPRGSTDRTRLLPVLGRRGVRRPLARAWLRGPHGEEDRLHPSCRDRRRALGRLTWRDGPNFSAHRAAARGNPAAHPRRVRSTRRATTNAEMSSSSRSPSSSPPVASQTEH